MVHVRLTKTAGVESVESPTLPDEVLTRLRRIVPPWRSNRSVLQELDTLRTSLAPDGLVVVFTMPQRTLAAPAPLRVPIEPTELDEARSPLADLLEESIAADPKLQRARWWRRFALRGGIPLIVLAANLPNAIFQIAFNPSAFTVLLWSGIFGLYVLVGAAIYLVSDPWFIMPGAVVVRRTFAGKRAKSMHYFTRHDSVLVVRPGNQAFAAQLWRGGTSKQRQLTTLEAASLIAAWTSPLEPPPRSRLSEWE
ncbi:MAG: hypothetical protein D6744_16635 [Planctomycetota bacterium]|nr:MAG: hypothetical protein D6744_16635 [Planctomycetota bacterium]